LLLPVIRSPAAAVMPARETRELAHGGSCSGRARDDRASSDSDSGRDGGSGGRRRAAAAAAVSPPPALGADQLLVLLLPLLPGGRGLVVHYQ